MLYVVCYAWSVGFLWGITLSYKCQINSVQRFSTKTIVYTVDRLQAFFSYEILVYFNVYVMDSCPQR